MTVPATPARPLLLFTLTVGLLSGCQLPTWVKPQSELVTNEWPSSSAGFFIDQSNPYLCKPLPYPPPEGESLNLWDSLRQGFSLSGELHHERVDAERRWLLQHPEYLVRVSERAQRYLYAIVQSLNEREMPLELALLPIVESAFDPFAYSHGRAAGMWQFIPGTAQAYDLRMDWWYDGRRDVLESTRAALDYLSHLNRLFDGDWLLALASYNSGQGTVARAVKRNAAAGLPTHYWQLDLPKETEAYVPRLLALVELVRDPAAFGIELPELPNAPYFEVVELDGQIDLAQAAQMAGIAIEELYKLNPGFNRWATAPEGPHRLLLPIAQADTFRLALASLPPEQRVAWKRYQVQSGDSLLRIAQQHRTTVEELQRVNQIESAMIRRGDFLIIPQPIADASQYSHSSSARLARQQQRPAGSGRIRQDYTVKAGDSLWSIARRYDVSVGALAKWNAMAPKDPLQVGQRLAIWQEAGSPPAGRTLRSDSRTTLRKIGYTVRQGDSLARIAGRFNLAVNDIIGWNELNPKAYLQPGQSLILFVDVTQAY